MAELQVLAPLRIESFAYGGADTVIVGRSQPCEATPGARSSPLDLDAQYSRLALVGVAGALDPQLVPGDLIIASELRSTESTTSRNLPGAALLSAEFKRCRIDVHTGPVVTSSSFVTAGRRSDLFDSGALAVDMESSWVMDYLPNNPLAVVRAISDTATRGPLRGGLRALGSLSAARGPLDRWARACGERESHPRLAALFLRRSGTRHRNRRASDRAVRGARVRSSSDRAQPPRGPRPRAKRGRLRRGDQRGSRWGRRGARRTRRVTGSPSPGRRAHEPDRDRRDLSSGHQGAHRGAP